MMKSSRDVVGHLDDFLFRIGDSKVPYPSKIAVKRVAIMNGRVSILVNPGFRNVLIYISLVPWVERGCGVDP